MGIHFTPRERSAVHRLLANHASDIVLKIDCQGFILHAASALDHLEGVSPDRLTGRNLFDLIHPAWAETVREEHAAAVARGQLQARLEFPVVIGDQRERWYELQLSCLADDREEVYAAVGIMRSIEERRRLEEKLFAASMTDSLTNLTNRRAFVAMLQHLVDRGTSGCVALFEIDHFKTINMRYGHAVGDEVLVVFADFLRTMMGSQDIVSRVGGQTLGVLMPRTAPEAAEATCREVIRTLGEIRQSSGSGTFCITASGGLAPIDECLDSTIKRAELALFHAKAKGRNRLEIDSGAISPWTTARKALR